MAKPHVHAESSARKFGGVPEDYLDIHLFLDSSKASFADNRHRAMTHNAWFVHDVIPLVFGHTRPNSDGTRYSTVDVAEQHVAEDFGGYIPSPADFLSCMEMHDWMNNGGGGPPSQRKVAEWRKKRAAAKRSEIID